MITKIIKEAIEYYMCEICNFQSIFKDHIIECERKHKMDRLKKEREKEKSKLKELQKICKHKNIEYNQVIINEYENDYSTYTDEIQSICIDCGLKLKTNCISDIGENQEILEKVFKLLDIT